MSERDRAIDHIPSVDEIVIDELHAHPDSTLVQAVCVALFRHTELWFVPVTEP